MYTTKLFQYTFTWQFAHMAAFFMRYFHTSEWMPALQHFLFVQMAAMVFVELEVFYKGRDKKQ
jgi:hypothetical protein